MPTEYRNIIILSIILAAVTVLFVLSMKQEIKSNYQWEAVQDVESVSVKSQAQYEKQLWDIACAGLAFLTAGLLLTLIIIIFLSVTP